MSEGLYLMRAVFEHEVYFNVGVLLVGVLGLAGVAVVLE